MIEIYIGLIAISVGLIAYIFIKELSVKEESEVYKLIRRDMLDPEMVWSGSGTSLKNHTKDYTYASWGGKILFHDHYEDAYVDYEVTLSKSENKKLGRLAEAIVVRKLLKEKS